MTDHRLLAQAPLAAAEHRRIDREQDRLEAMLARAGEQLPGEPAVSRHVELEPGARPPVAAISSQPAVARVERHMIVPAAAAARDNRRLPFRVGKAHEGDGARPEPAARSRGRGP